MKLIHFLRKNDLDEMQEQKLLKIEHNGFWLSYVGVFVLFMAQLLIYRGDFRMVGGEFLLLMVLSVYVTYAAIKAGIWSRRLQPNLKSNVLSSLLGSVFVFIFLGIAVFVWFGSPLAAVITAALGGVIAFVLTLLVLQVFVKEYKKQRERLDGEDEE